MPNNYYTFSPAFVPNTRVRSEPMNTQLAGIETGFDFLPSDNTALIKNRADFGGSTAGSGNAYTLTMPDTRLTYTDGDRVSFRADRSNTGPATLNIDTIGAQPLRLPDGSPLVSNEIVGGRIYEAQYDLTNNQWLLRGQVASIISSVRGSGVDDPTSIAAQPYDFDASVVWANANSQLTAQQGWTGALADEFTTQVEAWGATYGVRARDDTGALRLLMTANPNEGIDLYWAGAGAPTRVFRTLGQGTVSVNSIDEVDSSIRQLVFETQAGTLRGGIGNVSTINLDVFNNIEAALVRIQGNPTGALPAGTSMAEFDPDAGVKLFYNGDSRFEVIQFGTLVRSSNDIALGGNQDVAMNFERADGTGLGRVGYNGASPFFDVFSSNDGGGVRIIADNAVGTQKNLFIGDPDGGVDLYDPVADVVRLRATQSGRVDIRSDGNTLTEERRIRFRLQDDTAVGYIGYVTDATLTLANLAVSGAVRLEGTNSVSAQRIMIEGDPDGSVTIRNPSNDTIAFQTGNFGVHNLRSPGNGVETLILDFQQQDGTEKGSVGYPGAVSYIALRNRINSGGLRLEADDSVGTTQPLLVGDPDAGVDLYYAGDSRFEVGNFGVALRSSNDIALGGNQDVAYNLLRADGTNIGRLGYSGADPEFQVYSGNHGAAMELIAENAAGTATLLVSGNPDGGDPGVGLYHAGILRFSTLVSGVVSLRSDTSADGTIKAIAFEHQNGTQRGFFGINGAAGDEFVWQNNIHGANARVQLENDVGTVITPLTMDPDTESANLTEVYLFQEHGLKIKPGNTLRNTTTTLADDPDLAGWTIKAGQKYTIEGWIRVFSASATPDFDYAFQFSQTMPAGTVITAYHLRDDGTTGGTTHVMTTEQTVDLDGSNVTAIHFIGTVVGHATLDAVMDFQWAQNVSDATDVLLIGNSWIKLERAE